MTTTAAPVLPMLLAEVEVVSIERVSPTFLRFELGSPALAELGVEGPSFDQRFKLVLPDPVTGAISSVADADETWMSTWLDRSTEERGHMRTYTIRALRGSGADTRLVVDIAVHGSGIDAGPGSRWASTAAPGDRVVVLAPRRGYPFGGIEFAPPSGSDLLLAADETAVPAVCSILEQLPSDARGAVFMEVPVIGDVLDVRRPPQVEVTWLPRNGAPLGERLHASVVAHLGLPAVALDVAPDDVDPDLWETPTYSSSGEVIEGATRGDGHELDGLYAWIAGESKVVTGLRRHLVSELGMDRRQVAFMGYWRRGVAMRS